MFTLTIAATAVASGAATNTAKPNIVFILADDLGYNELNFMNTTRGILTPHLDSLANSGVIMKNYYVQPICSPTRSALMTGRYTTRLGTQSSVIYWDTPWGIPLNETFLPQNLKDAGYSTAMFGKWHLGMHKQAHTPMKRGFDTHMGYYQGCESAFTHVAACCTAGSPDSDENFVCDPGKWGKEDFRGYDWFKTDPAQGISVPDFSVNHTVSAVLIRDRAVEFLKSRKGQDQNSNPFFLYLPFQNIHSPYTGLKMYRDMYNSSSSLNDDEKTLFGYLTEMDDMIGSIVAAMKANGVYEDSVIIFSSDNGAPGESADVNHMEGPANPGWIARNYPFRGQKTQIWEGGTRVAGFVHSPREDLLPSAVRGTESKELYHVTDWLPTIVGLGGGVTTRNFALDGHDIWPSLSKPKTVASPRTEMLYNVNPLCDGGQAGMPKAGLRMGKYKLLAWCYGIKGIAGGNHTGPVNAPADSDPKRVDPAFTKGVVMYDLDADPAERNNLNTASMSDDLKQILSKMEVRLRQLAEESVEPMQWTAPFQGADYECADCPLHPPGTGPDKAWGPWL